jgi:hypothetical protein
MSYRQTIQVFYPVDVKRYLDVLTREFAAMENPYQRGSYLIDNPPLPFYEPTIVDDHLAIVSFNRLPLSPFLVKALELHPELVPASAHVRWLEEQELVVRGSIEGIAHRLRGKER